MFHSSRILTTMTFVGWLVLCTAGNAQAPAVGLLQPMQKDGPKKFDLKFPGGGLTAYVEMLKSLDPSFQVIVQPSAERIVLPEFELTNVESNQALKLIVELSDIRVNPTIKQYGSIYILGAVDPKPFEQKLTVINLANIIAEREVAIFPNRLANSNTQGGGPYGGGIPTGTSGNPYTPAAGNLYGGGGSPYSGGSPTGTSANPYTPTTGSPYGGGSPYGPAVSPGSGGGYMSGYVDPTVDSNAKRIDKRIGDILKAIDIALDMIGDEAPKPVIKVHKDTMLLLFSGTTKQIDVVKQITQQLSKPTPQDSGMKGDVQLEFVPDLDIVIVKGAKQDVQRVLETIKSVSGQTVAPESQPQSSKVPAATRETPIKPAR